jgi:hypothetical protein
MYATGFSASSALGKEMILLTLSTWGTEAVTKA